MTVEIGIELFEKLSDKLTGESEFRKRKEETLYQVPIIGQLAASGTLDNPAQLQPVTGRCWSVRRLTCFGWTAGSVTVYINNLEPAGPFPNPGVATYGRGEFLLMPHDKLVVVATGITGSVTLMGVADSFQEWYLPHYIG